MKIIGWNVKGVGKKVFSLQLIDLLNSHKPDITILMKVE